MQYSCVDNQNNKTILVYVASSGFIPFFNILYQYKEFLPVENILY